MIYSLAVQNFDDPGQIYLFCEFVWRMDNKIKVEHTSKTYKTLKKNKALFLDNNITKFSIKHGIVMT